MTATVHNIEQHDQRADALRRLTGEPRVLEIDAEETTDNRHKKRYFRKVSVLLDVAAEPDDERTSYHQRGKNHPHTRKVQEAMFSILGVKKTAVHWKHAWLLGDHNDPWTKIKVDELYCDWKNDTFKVGDRLRYNVTLEFHSERPSQIVSEEHATKWTRKHIVPAFTQAMASARAERREELRREKAVRDANELGSQVGAEMRKRAKLEVRYEQRLAALRAELEAEIDVQVAAYVATGKLREEVAESDYDWEPDAVEYTLAHLREQCGSRDLFRGSHSEWTMEDLYPEEG